MGAAHASRRLLSCTLSASGVSGSGCPRGEGAAVTCLQVRRPDGCTDWFLTPSFSSQLLGPEGNPPGGAMCPAMEAGLTLAPRPSDWLHVLKVDRNPLAVCRRTRAQLCTMAPCATATMEIPSHLPPGVWSQEISHRAEQLRGRGGGPPSPVCLRGQEWLPRALLNAGGASPGGTLSLAQDSPGLPAGSSP